jgi:hypothetical protein
VSARAAAAAGVVAVSSGRGLANVKPGTRLRVGAGEWVKLDDGSFQGAHGLMAGRVVSAAHMMAVADARPGQAPAGALTARLTNWGGWLLVVSEVVGGLLREVVTVRGGDLFMVEDDPTFGAQCALAELGFQCVSEWTNAGNDGHDFACDLVPLPDVPIPGWATTAYIPGPGSIDTDGTMNYEFVALIGSTGKGKGSATVDVSQDVTVRAGAATVGKAHINLFTNDATGLSVADTLRISGWLGKAATLVSEVNAAAFKGASS